MIRVLAAAFAICHAAQYGLFLGSWLVLGGAALDGDVTGRRIALWAAALAGSLLCRAVAVRLQGELATAIGGRLRGRLLRGALALDESHVRREGTGHLLGRVLEAESLEDLAVGGALAGLAGGLELLLAGVLLTAALGPVAGLLLAAWLVVAAVLLRQYEQRRRRWSAVRLALGNTLAEHVAGHRTRAVQQPEDPPGDGTHDLHDTLARRMDHSWTALTALVPRGWALTGVVLLAARAAQGADRVSVAAAAGGVLFTFGALSRLSGGFAGLADARCAWDALRPLLPRGSTEDGPLCPDGMDGAPLLEAEGVGYTYPGRERPVLRQVTLRVGAGDRILLEGASGSGKSTLAGLLGGQRAPSSGVLRLHGATLAEVGAAGWRRRVLTVPQPDHNHLMLGPLALNLLIGRGWPATPGDLADADAVCRALGLGDLLDRMPSGLAQIVGETGWQLSHGERSLVFLARALLQEPEVLVLDETFGALDPHTLERALAVTRERARTLLVIRQ
ncbi:ATP-binding cassette domain-containing protein [Dactylosporangium sp. NPDC000521]|uniref:ATP-binding cassette domain-containing protein n=1 Tax=Dactylosporangium sp. NPDC000521 TaxID=3363975 RepID=UPI003682123E